VNRVVGDSQGWLIRNLFMGASAGLEEYLEQARHHRQIFRCPEWFPRRNAILGRTSSPEETEWPDSPGAFSP
jgi:uncharacterized protein (DUF924 family)